jgi:hypothetical protein
MNQEDDHVLHRVHRRLARSEKPPDMLISNASQYDTHELARLIRYAFKGMPGGNVGVNVIDLKMRPGQSLGVASANARDGVSRSSPFRGVEGITRTVTLRLGPPSHYPADNLYTYWVRRRQIPVQDHILFDEKGNRRTGSEAIEYVRGLLQGDEQIISYDRRRTRITVAEKVRQPYGGKSSPYFEYLDWQEGVVAYTAHEARHIWQFVQRAREWKQRGLKRPRLTPLSEVDAERYAFHVLTCFRRERHDVLRAPVRVAARRGRNEDIPLYGIARLLAPHPDED